MKLSESEMNNVEWRGRGEVEFVEVFVDGFLNWEMICFHDHRPGAAMHTFVIDSLMIYLWMDL